MSPTFRVFLVPAIAALAILAACGGGERGRGPEAVVPSGPREDAVPVRVAEVRPGRFRESLELTGTLAPLAEVTVSTENGGLVRELGFEKGDRVETGAILARVGDDLAESRLAQARADLAAAEANYAKVSKLFERQAVPRQDLVAATSRRDRERARVRELTLLLERAVIRAPIDGVAVDRPVDVGEVLAPGTRVTTLQRTDRLKVRVDVPDTEIAWVTRGTTGEVRVDAWPGRTFPARVTFVGPAADPNSRTFPVELVLANPRGELRPGMVARVRLLHPPREDAIVVPLDAVLRRAGGFAAFVVEDGVARERELVLGGRAEGRVLVRSGLAPGDLLVVAGQRDLEDGRPVRVTGRAEPESGP